MKPTKKDERDATLVVIGAAVILVFLLFGLWMLVDLGSPFLVFEPADGGFGW